MSSVHSQGFDMDDDFIAYLHNSGTLDFEVNMTLNTKMLLLSSSMEQVEMLLDVPLFVCKM